MHMTSPACSRCSHQGATLIEILVTIVILSFGVLSLAGLQAYSVAANKNAVNRGLAGALAADLADMIRANAEGFVANQYTKVANFSATETAIPDVGSQCAYPDCSTNALATRDKAMFMARLKATLRAGSYAVTKVSDTAADIHIMWVEQRAAGTAAAEKSFDSCPEGVRNLDPLPRCYYVRVNL